MIILQFLSTIFMFVMNTIAIVLPLNGVTTKELSDTFTTLITPAGFTFSIWSVIYLWLLILTIAILIGKLKLPKITLSRYICSCLCNGLWIVAWHYGNLHLSILLMLGILWSLIMVDRSMIGKPIEYYPFVRAIFLTYLWWIVVASLLNTLIYMKYQLGIVGGYETIIAIVALCFAAAINIYTINKEKNIATAVVFVWAMYGISQVNGTMESPIWWTVHGLGLVMIGAIWREGRKWVR
jgi:translocator protein